MSPLSLPVIAPLADGFARRIRYLRVSLTDRCNYRCTYCMPDEGMVFRPRNELLSFEEIERLVTVFAGLGVKRVRLTGGEPTVRADVVELVRRVAAIDGIEAVVMTSNGHRFPELAQPLAAAGLSGVNISIDTLDPERFRALTRRGDVHRVIAGIDAAIAAGLNVKLNAVALKSADPAHTHADIVGLCEFAWARAITPRFIEHMPMSEGQLYEVSQELPAAQIRQIISEHFGTALAPETSTDSANGPARYWLLDDASTKPDAVAAANSGTKESTAESNGDATETELAVARLSRRRIGIISAMSEHFCDTCNRLRLSAIGELHACLAYDDAISLRDVVRAGGSDDDVRRAIMSAVAGKRLGHEFQRDGGGAPRKHMIAIGG